MKNKLFFLKPQFKQSLSAEFFESDSRTSNLDQYLEPFGRDLDLEPLVTIVDKAMQKFDSERSKSDSWLAPRVHATLRLSRREAGDRRLWSYLAAGPLFKYVHWRWRQDKKASGKFPVRFFGAMREQAISRLWWGAELTRNGRSYENTVKFFSNTDVPNSWMNLQAMQHRATAIAAVSFIYDRHVEGVPVGDRHRDLSKSFNAALTTTVLDAIAENPLSDSATLDEWINQEPDETLYFEADPIGPNEVDVPVQSVDNVLNLLDRVAAKTNFQARARTAKTE